MSEVKLNLVDANRILSGTIHGSQADRCIAALSAEPETISELVAALGRYSRPKDDCGPFSHFRTRSEIDTEPYDAGIVIVDLAARVIAVESTYSSPSTEGEVTYHDGEKATDVSIPYRLPDDWRSVSSVEAYRWTSERRRRERESNPPLDARTVLYGSPLLEFIKNAVNAWATQHEPTYLLETENIDGFDEATTNAIVRIHAEWLMTPREDLRGKSPREVLLEKQHFIDFDLDTRSLQWSMLAEGPPCLSPDSFAYRFGGFGTHEWVVYYDLIRYLLGMATYSSTSSAQLVLDEHRKSATATADDSLLASTDGMKSVPSAVADGSAVAARDVRSLSRPSGIADGTFSVRGLERLKYNWLERPNPDYSGRVPAIIIENERKRLPQAMSSQELIIDEDCECCQMLAREAEMGSPTFWHLDGSYMEDDFAFSPYLTRQQWEAEMQRREEMEMEFAREQHAEELAGGQLAEELAHEHMAEEFARRDYEKRQWDEDQERLARGKIIVDPDLFDLTDPDPF